MRSVGFGEASISRVTTMELIRRLRAVPEAGTGMRPVKSNLTSREGEVLDLLVDGLAIAQIARRLYISESTAKTHVANIYEKLGAGNRAQAVMAAVRLGLVDDIKKQ